MMVMVVASTMIIMLVGLVPLHYAMLPEVKVALPCVQEEVQAACELIGSIRRRKSLERTYIYI